MWGELEVSLSCVVQGKRGSKRQYFEKVVDMLERCSDFQTPRYLVRNTRLQLSVACRLFNDLTERGLLEKTNVLKKTRLHSHALSSNPQKYSRCLYRRTVKGSEFLRLWKLLMKIWNGVV